MATPKNPLRICSWSRDPSCSTCLFYIVVNASWWPGACLKFVSDTLDTLEKTYRKEFLSLVGLIVGIKCVNALIRVTWQCCLIFLFFERFVQSWSWGKKTRPKTKWRKMQKYPNSFFSLFGFTDLTIFPF
jgi:hypothetical protein